jgi:primase-polymerase (primpol)-like protein
MIPAAISPSPTQLYQQLRTQQAGAKMQAKPSANGTAPSPDLDDDTVIQKALAARNGQKFAKLWAGDTSDYAFQNPDGSINPGRSEADLAFCRELSFWTQDRQQIDRLLRRSGLMRDKWDQRADYLEWTISKALETTPEHYQRVSVDSRNGQPQDRADEPEEEPYHSSEERDEDHSADDEQHEDDYYKPIPPYLIKWSSRQGNALYYQKPGTTDEQILKPRQSIIYLCGE